MYYVVDFVEDREDFFWDFSGSRGYVCVRYYANGFGWRLVQLGQFLGLHAGHVCFPLAYYVMGFWNKNLMKKMS